MKIEFKMEEMKTRNSFPDSQYYWVTNDQQ